MNTEEEIVKVLRDNKPSKFIKWGYSITGVGNPFLRWAYVTLMISLFTLGIVFELHGKHNLMVVSVMASTILLFSLVFLQLSVTLLNNKRISKISKELGVSVFKVSDYYDIYRDKI